MPKSSDYTLEFLLAFDRRVHHLEDGYWIKFDIKTVEASTSRPHGLSYSFTLHAPDGTRLVGFDNAHGARLPRVRGSRIDRLQVIIGIVPRMIRDDLTNLRTQTHCFRIFSERFGGY